MNIRTILGTPKLEYNHYKYNYWFLISFSFLSIWFHSLPVSKQIHDVLYSSNVFALIGYTVIMVCFPTRFYTYYGETFHHMLNTLGLSKIVPLNVYTLHLYAWIGHAIPVWILRNKYSMANPIWWFIVYFVFAGAFLGKIYNLDLYEMVFVFVSTSALFYLYYIEKRMRKNI